MALPLVWLRANVLPLACICAAWLVLASPGELKAFEPATPHLNAFLAGLEQREPRPVPPGLRAFAGDSTALRLNAADLTHMFTAAEQDTLTLLRVNVVLARWIAERNLPLYADGEAVDEALKQGFSLGLTFPLHHVSYLFFSPDAARSGDFLIHIRALYDINYTFRFDRDILNADVIVHGTETAYTDDSGPRTSYLVTLELYDELEWARYTDFEGLSGRKRGVAGFFQRVLFFIPKTLDGLELRDGHLKIKAFIDQNIEDFERLERYHVRR
ncbi:MAG: hypothetical protein OXH56_01085 [Gemmatimonadetes bacterium]|nr:hypothetical protein [Gemmatimonadota bacterium]